MMTPKIRCCLFVSLLAFAIGCWQSAPPAAAPSKAAPSTATKDAPANPAAGMTKPEKLTVKHLPNAIRVHEKVISGGLPEGDEAFAELKELGVKTVISVDGAKPDVAIAEKHGMRYVHLPHSYDGIPDETAARLAKAVHDLPGSVYIHCHHGKHRSPAASAVACVAAGLIEPSAALPILEMAGTNPNYRGLYQSARETKPLSSEKLAAVSSDFPATVNVEALAEAMVNLEHTHDHLKQLAANKWQVIPTKSDLDSAHEALLLREHYTEMLRLKEVQSQGAEFVKVMEESEVAAKQLETALETWSKGDKSQPAPAAVEMAWEKVNQQCASCHKAFRDVPLSEKKGKK